MIYNTISDCARRGEKMLVRLIDPDKFDAATLCEGFDLYFVGGSTADGCSSVVRAIHDTCSTPVVLFPGNPGQFTPEADALLFLTLMNSRDPRFLIDWQLQSADAIVDSGIESIPMGYILVDGGRKSTTQQLTGATPVPQGDIPAAVRMARAAQLLGKQLIYLEAGSGAETPVSRQVISAVRQAVNLPLIVGGGICTPQQMLDAYAAGADIVVIGNHFEQHPEQMADFIGVLSESYRSTNAVIPSHN